MERWAPTSLSAWCFAEASTSRVACRFSPWTWDACGSDDPSASVPFSLVDFALGEAIDVKVDRFKKCGFCESRWLEVILNVSLVGEAFRKECAESHHGLATLVQWMWLEVVSKVSLVWGSPSPRMGSISPWTCEARASDDPAASVLLRGPISIRALLTDPTLICATSYHRPSGETVDV